MKFEGSTSNSKCVRHALIAVLGGLLAAACSTEREAIKKGVIGALADAKSKDIAVDLNEFSKRKIVEICIQTPYMTKKLTEERIGAGLEGFSEVDDSSFVLWVLHGQGSPTQITFNRSTEVNFGDPSLEGCALSSKVYFVNSKLYLQKP